MASLVFDPVTRDLVLDGDSAQLTDNPTTEILLALGVEQNSFHGDPDQGSRIPSLVTGPPPVDARREVEQAAHEGLERLETQGLITVTDVVFDSQTLTVDVEGYRVDIEVTA